MLSPSQLSPNFTVETGSLYIFNSYVKNVTVVAQYIATVIYRVHTSRIFKECLHLCIVQYMFKDINNRQTDINHAMFTC